MKFSDSHDNSEITTVTTLEIYCDEKNISEIEDDSESTVFRVFITNSSGASKGQFWQLYLRDFEKMSLSKEAKKSGE